MGEKFSEKKSASISPRPPSFWARAALCLALSASAALFSCKKEGKTDLAEYTALSKIAAEKSAAADWAYEIEGERLLKKINSFESISKSVPLSPLALAALEGGSPMRGIYPDLRGFGNLDTSSVQGDILDAAISFCEAVVSYSNERALPLPDESEKGAASVPAKKKDSSKMDALFSPKTRFSLSLFLADSEFAWPLRSFVAGRPFVGDDLIEIPVRFEGESQFLFCKLFPAMEGGSWKIQQIEIYKSEEKNGIVKTDGN